MSKIVFNPVHKNKLQFLATAADISIIDTRTNILAESPTEGTIAISTDEPAFYMYDGTDWQRSPIIFGTPETGTSMGAFPYVDDKGYGEQDLSGKTLHNTIISNFDSNTRTASEGGLKYNAALVKMQGYVDGEWRNFLAYSTAEEDAIMLWTDDWGVFDIYGRNIIHGNKVDMGVFASDHLLDGGLLSDQVVT